MVEECSFWRKLIAARYSVEPKGWTNNITKSSYRIGCWGWIHKNWEEFSSLTVSEWSMVKGCPFDMMYSADPCLLKYNFLFFLWLPVIRTIWLLIVFAQTGVTLFEILLFPGKRMIGRFKTLRHFLLYSIDNYSRHLA